MTNSHLIAALAEQRIADLRRAGSASRVAVGPTPRHGATQLRRPSRARRQAGWWLVTFGLRLAIGPAAVSQ